MSSPAFAIACEFRWRHRLGLIVFCCYLFALAVIRLLLIRGNHPIQIHDGETFAFLVIVPLTSTFMYFLAVFSFGLSGDLAARESIFPGRMFTLPVNTSALTLLPMLYGGIVMLLLWFATRLFALWPDDFHVPWIWPGILAVALLAWTQALTWISYPLRGLRVIVTVLWLASIDAVVMAALQYKASESVMLILLAPQLPLAYLVARYAVSRARCGDVSARIFHATLIKDPPLLRKRKHFRSAAFAQVWYEWRTHGWKLPMLVAILLPFELALLSLFRETSSIVYETIFAILITPPFLAAFVAATVAKPNSPGSDSNALIAFFATRPLSSTQLIAAKLKATILSAFAAWILILLVVPPALKLSGTWVHVVDSAQGTIKVMGKSRSIAIAILGLLLFVMFTWKQLVKNLYIGMSGRDWLIKGSVFFTLSFLAVIGPLAYRIHKYPAAMAALWSAIPYVTALLVCVKIAGAAWILTRLHRSHIVGDRVLIYGVVSWCLSVFLLYRVFTWIFPAVVVRGYFLGLLAILVVPLTRLAAAPLALVWNRHRGRMLLNPSQKGTLALALMLISLPAMYAFMDGARFYTSNRNNGVLWSTGEMRQYLLHVPKTYDSSHSTALVISLHGAGGWPTQQMMTSQWSRLADSEGFLVVYPSAMRGFGPPVWRVDPGPGLAKDVRFISDLIDHLKASYNINRARIYVNGLSNGGGMAFALSCTLSDRIAAVGMVGAAQTLPWKWCGNTQAVPMIDFHGTADPVMPYNGGYTWVDSGYFPAVVSFAAKWAKRNRCADGPFESHVANDVLLREYSGCADNATVAVYTIQGGGHTWPGGTPFPEFFSGKTTNSIDATRLMWDFFRKHPKK